MQFEPGNTHRKSTLFSFRLPWINPKLCRNFFPSTIPAITIAFAIDVYQNGQAEGIYFREPLSAYNLAIFNFFNVVRRTSPQETVRDRCITSINFSLDFTNRITIEQPINSTKTSRPSSPRRCNWAKPVSLTQIAVSHSNPERSTTQSHRFRKTKFSLCICLKSSFQSDLRMASYHSNSGQELPSRNKTWHLDCIAFDAMK
jgi:hypothetical protein